MLVNTHFNLPVLKLSTLAFVGYVASSVVMSIIASSIWLAGQDITGLSEQDIAFSIANDMSMTMALGIGSIVISLLLAIWATNKSPNTGYGVAITLAALLTAYGIVSIYLHPEHELMRQVLKVIVPWVSCLLGGKIALCRSTMSSDLNIKDVA